MPGSIGRRLGLEGIVLVALILAGIGTFGLIALAKSPAMIDNPDVEDMAQIARRLRENHTFTTLFMPLNGLDYLRLIGWRGDAWPAMTRFPLMPITLAAITAILGEGDFALALGSGLFWIAGIPVLYLFTRRLFNRYAAILAVLIYLGPANLRYLAASGMTEPAGAFFLLAAVAALWGTASPRRLILGGAALGLGYLARNNLALFMIPITGYLVWEGGARRALLFLGGFLPLFGVGALSNYILSGDSLFNLQFSSALFIRANSGILGWYEPEYIQPLEYILGHPSEFLAKLYSQGMTFVNEQGPALALSPYGLAIVLVALVRPYPRPLHRLRILVVAMLGMQVVFVSALAAAYGRMYVILEPVVLPWVAGLLVEVASAVIPQRAAWGRWAVIGAGAGWLLVNGVQLAGAGMIRVPSEMPARGASVETCLSNMDYIKQRVHPNAVIASDLPWSVAWRADRRAIPLPATPGDLDTVVQRLGVEIDAIYIKGARHGDEPPSWEAWRELRARQDPLPGYWLDQVFSDGSVLYIKE